MWWSCSLQSKIVGAGRPPTLPFCISHWLDAALISTEEMRFSQTHLHKDTTVMALSTGFLQRKKSCEFEGENPFSPAKVWDPPGHFANMWLLCAATFAILIQLKGQKGFRRFLSVITIFVECENEISLDSVWIKCAADISRLAFDFFFLWQRKKTKGQSKSSEAIKLL